MMEEDPYIDEETLDRARDEKFAQWFKEHIQSNDGNEHLKVLARGPMRYVESYKGYFVNGYKFHTLKHGDGWVTHNSGVCVKGSTYNEFESDYYGLLVDVLEVNYRDSNGRCVVVLFKCDWFEPIQGVRVNPRAAVEGSVYEVTQCSSEVVDDNVDAEAFFQENEMPICSNTSDANKNDEVISLVTQGEMEEVGDLDVGNAYMEVSENEEEFVDTYDNMEVSEDEEEFIDTYDDLDDNNELNLSDYSSDEEEVRILAKDNNNRGRGRGRGRSLSVNKGIAGTSSASNYDDGSISGGRGRGNIGIGVGSSNVARFSNQDDDDGDYDDGSRIGRRGRGRTGNIGIGGKSNVARLGNQDRDCDDASRTGGRGRGRSGPIGIGVGSNVAELGNQNGDYDEDSRSLGRGRGRSKHIGIGVGSNVAGLGNQNGDYDEDSRSLGRGRGRSKHIGIGVGSNVAGLGNQNGDYDDDSRSLGRGRGRSEHIGIGCVRRIVGISYQYERIMMFLIAELGRGRGRSEHIGIGVGSNVAGLGNQNGDYDDDRRSLGRGMGISEHIGISVGSNVAGFGNQDGDHVDGSRSLGRGQGRSSNVSRGRSGHIGNQDVDYDYDNGSIDYDNGTHGDTNDNATETSQHVCGSNLLQSIPNHPSQRPMITLYYGGFAEPHVTRDIISILKISFYGSWTTWREDFDKKREDIMFEEFQDQYQWHPSENATVYRAWEKVMSSRFSDILGACRREAALRATEDNIKVGNDLSVLKPYTPSWIDQADWEDMIDMVWNTSRWKKKSTIARQNRLSEVDGQVSKHTAGSITILQHKFKMVGKTKKRSVSLLEAYEYTHTQETTEALGNGTGEGSGDGTDETVGSGTREYITRRSKRVADAVEAAMEDEHGPDASQHPPNDFGLWEKATGGKKKADLVYLERNGNGICYKVQTLEETIRQLQEDNKQMRARSEVEMQVEVQRQVESQLQEHMRQRELEANAREEAREREWQRKMDDINLMLKKYNDPRPPQ
ncbi:transposase, Ptta/En/Spm [Tanacetum coccineum]